MENKIKIIIKKLIQSRVDMNAFLKASDSSIQQEIVKVIRNGYKNRKLVILKKKPFRY